MTTRYRQLDPQAPAAALETELLERWRAEDLFGRTRDARADAPLFVFYEGPPTANGRPGIHHVFSRTIKDLVCRYRTMRGYRVPRKAGWDTHGLPVEIEVEKGLPARLAAERGMSAAELSRASGKQLIETFGVEEFNRACRESVFRYRAEWEKLSERIAYWLDYAHPYVTFSNEYVESVWWALSSLHQRELLYRGHKILPYCGRCGTALSSHELALGYRDVEDPSVYVALDLEGGPALPAAGNGVARRRILVWTTTPWTLPSNVALAVHPELEYLEVRKTSAPDWTIVLAAARAEAVLGEGWTDRWTVEHRMAGTALVGARYRRPLDWVSFDGTTGAHEVIVGETFVSAEDGSGVVHMAPAFGADDYAAGKRHGLAFLQPVDGSSSFVDGTPVVGGRFVKDADATIIEELERRDVLWKTTREVHSYPHCWRCGTPLVYMARDSWFVRTTASRDRMLARNARIDWHPPETGQRRFGEWLENNIDWAVSRDRYWGTPLPVWVNDADPAEIEVIGSYAELESRVGTPLGGDFDPHKPFIDRLTWPARSGRGTMRRVPQVIDAWFDSGSMPFAQWHFPFENRETVAREYPADFIAEGVDQTRGWFYSLLAIATGLGEALPGNPDVVDHAACAPRPAPFGAAVVNDQMLDAEGQKMSKSRGNVVDPWGVIERHGVDAIRLFLVASSQLDVPRRFDEAAIRETSARFLVTLRNVYSGMFALYANFGWSPSDADPALADRPAIDRWILSRLSAVEAAVDARLHAYDPTNAARLLMAFVDDEVSNWWVRLNRGRLYDVESADNRAAYATLHEVLTVSCRLLAPLAPFISDWMHRELTGESVHLAAFVRDEPSPRDERLEAAMDEVRLLARLGRGAREEAGVKVRQPLARLQCVVPQSIAHEVETLFPLLAAELNVKEISLLSSADSLVALSAQPNFRALGRRFGKETPRAAAAVAALDGERLRAFEQGNALSIDLGDGPVELGADDLTILRRSSGALLVQEENGRFVAIDAAITPELRAEGLAREFVSRVQRLRRDAGLLVSDRIRLAIATRNAELTAAIRGYHDWIAGELLAREIRIGIDIVPESQAAADVELDGASVRVALTRDG
jgi:isoleucyl-tRNA synthetase